MNKLKAFNYLLVAALILILISNTSFAQTDVNEDIRTNTTWTADNSPYILHSDLTIRDEATLTIESGVIVNCQNRYIFVGKYKSAKIIADGVVFNNGSIEFIRESNGSILNSTFNMTHLNLEEYSLPDVQNNSFVDEVSPYGSLVFIHSPDAFHNFHNNSFVNGYIVFSFDVINDLNIPYIENCKYVLDNDVFISEDAIFNIEKSTTIILDNISIIVGDYSDAQIHATEVNLLGRGSIVIAENSVGELNSCNISGLDFQVKNSGRLTIFNTNLDTESTIENISDSTVDATNNYWGRPEGPIMSDGEPVLVGDINYRPFSSVPLDPVTSVDGNKIVNENYELFQNYPNPFNPVTVIKYTIGANSSMTQSNVIIKVYDLLGREVETLVNKYQAPGNYSVSFNASKLSTGIYVYQLRHGAYNTTKKMIYLK